MAAPRGMSRLKQVALVNDYEIVLRGLAEMLDPFRDRLRVVELDVDENPRRPVDLALFDTYGHPRNGIDRVRELANDRRVGALVVYTWAITNEQVDACIAVGARGVLAKSETAEALAHALLAIESGEVVVSEVFHRPRGYTWPGHDLGLTARERGRGIPRAGPVESGHGRSAFHQRAHGEEPPQGDLPEDRCGLARAGGRSHLGRSQVPADQQHRVTRLGREPTEVDPRPVARPQAPGFS